MIGYILVAWFFFSLGMLFSQTEKGKMIILQIKASLDAAGIKSKKENI